MIDKRYHKYLRQTKAKNLIKDGYWYYKTGEGFETVCNNVSQLSRKNLQRFRDWVKRADKEGRIFIRGDKPHQNFSDKIINEVLQTRN